MLATELTARLSRHLLWERKQKNQTASSVLKRRHTAHDVADLKQYPNKVHLGTEDKCCSPRSSGAVLLLLTLFLLVPFNGTVGTSSSVSMWLPNIVFSL
jgi:hypothetical protein